MNNVNWIKKSDRINKLPPYLFFEIRKAKEEAARRGLDIIDLGEGDPDQPTPQNVIDKLKEASQNSENHKYPSSYEGLSELRKAIADWYKDRFSVDLNPDEEVLALLGGKEGVGHISFAFVNPGDMVLVPSPGYPVYSNSTILAGGNPFTMPLIKSNHFLPDLSSIKSDLASKVKLMFLNYPNNPTAAVANKEFFFKVVEFAQKYNIIVCHDNPYSEISFDGFKPMSFLQIPGSKEVGVEFHSFSKTYNMAGWRIGFVVGNKKVLEGLLKIKSQLDSGIPQAIQYGAIEALRGPQESVHKLRKIYQERRDILVEGLKELGWEVEKPKATFYVWATVPKGYTSTEFSVHLLSKKGIVVTPGSGYGEAGEGYIRIALVVSKERLKEALDRMRGI
jgi:LL-diaminopimelate aminotransferase